MKGKEPKEREYYVLRMADGTLVEVTREVYLEWHQSQGEISEREKPEVQSMQPGYVGGKRAFILDSNLCGKGGGRNSFTEYLPG